MSKQHSTLLPNTATMSNEFIVKFRPFDKVETICTCSICFDFVERTKFRSTVLPKPATLSQKRQQCRSNIDFVERIVRLVAFDNVASTLLLVWTGVIGWRTDLFPARLVANGWSNSHDVLTVIRPTLAVTQEYSETRLLQYRLHHHPINTFNGERTDAFSLTSDGRRILRGHHTHALHRCCLLPQMSHVASSVCLSVCLCRARIWSVQKRLNQSRCCSQVWLMWAQGTMH